MKYQQSDRVLEIANKVAKIKGIKAKLINVNLQL